MDQTVVLVVLAMVLGFAISRLMRSRRK